jgi:phosphatidylserine/phosphatidylglycerophosphate/cardiolipin synthase-like enzyme
MGSGDQATGYSGSSSYMYIEPLISGRGRTLRVICPFISARYAKLLVGQSARKEVSVITSNSNISADAVRIMKRGKRFPYLTLSAYFIILSIMIAALRLYLAELVLVPITALIVGITAAHYARPSKQRINVRVASESFVHEKIYLGDDHAVVGSANLTYSGLHKNVEHIEVIRDSAKLSQMSRHFEELWRSIAT